MKKILLSLAMALPILAFGQASPGGIGLPAIWLKGDAGLTGDNGQPATGWTNQGTIPFTLTPGSYPAPTKQANYATFASGQALAFDQTGTELSSVLGDGALDLRYEVFIVATGYTSGALLYMGNNTPETNGGVMNNIGFGKRAVYYNSNTQASASDGDGETGYYNSNNGILSKRYAPNIPDNTGPTDLSITNITSNPYNPYIDLNSMVFSINGLASIKQADGTDAQGQKADYQGKLNTYGSSGNKYNNLNVQKILLGGILKWDNSGIRRNFAGNYYEIIVYPHKLTTEERQKVLSYLAAKYNVYLIHDTGAYTGTATLGTSVGNGESVTNGTYFASDGSIIFKRDAYSYTNDQDYLGNAEVGFVKDTYYPLVTSNPNKNFQIFGRDDASGLSRFNTDNSSGAYFERNPKAQMTIDKSFAVLTSNAADFNTFSSTNDATTPFPVGANIEGRSARTWKLTTTGFNDGFQLTQSATSFISNNSLDMSNTVFLVSREPDFEASKTIAVTPGYVSGFINLNKKLSDIVGFTSAGEYKVFYLTVAKTNGSPTGLLNTLPVTFNSFVAKTKGNSVNVTWSTASEQNASHFIITRSTDGGNTFTEIGRVAASGNSISTKNYSFVDQNPNAGVNYYQLQQVDNDGKINESGIVSAKISLNTFELIVKEITSNSVALAVSGVINGTGTITAVNTQGQVIAKQEVNFNNSNTATINTGAAKGLIIFTLTSANGTVSKKIIK